MTNSPDRLRRYERWRKTRQIGAKRFVILFVILVAPLCTAGVCLDSPRQPTLLEVVSAFLFFLVVFFLLGTFCWFATERSYKDLIESEWKARNDSLP
jgi:lipopolysaccharide export LptBFGC system permease protein LptF